LSIQESKIPNAGWGLFTEASIKRGRVITEYGGKVVGHKEAKELLKTGDDTHLRSIAAMFQALDGRVTDDFPFTYYEENNLLGSFANSSPEPNAKYFVPRHRTGRIHPYGGIAMHAVYLVALRDIAAGEEIYVTYGKSYNKRHLQ
jgi:SET domain-containing protein